jgi:prepilin-type N-terminal cleavage/methylation domain-containing protein
VSRSRSNGSLRFLRRRLDAAGGFSLIEILVAITLLGLLAAAIVPLLISGLRASVIAKLDTGAKNLAQQRFELMRNLPFRIAYDPAITTGVDMLDSYYPNLTPPSGGFSTPGYVTTQARRPGEPTTGPFYRSKFVQTLGSTNYTEFVASQFLTPDTTPKVAVTPQVGYSTNTINDRAPSTLLGVTVVTEWIYGTKSKRLTVYTEISDVAPGPPLVTLQARATALRIASTVGLGVDQTDLLLESGVLNIDGGLSSGANAAVTATGGFASSTPGVRITGASVSKSAPPDALATSLLDVNSHDLTWLGDLVARVPRSQVENVAAKTSFGEPIAGTATPLTTGPIKATSLGTFDMRFTNMPNIDNATFGFNPSSLYIARQPAGASTQQAQSTGYAGSIGGTAHSASVGLTASTSTVEVLQTSFAPEGIIQMRLNSSSLTCGSNGATATSTPAYDAEIQFRTYTPLVPAIPSVGTYSWSGWTLMTGSQVTDPLAAVNLTAGPGGVPVGYSNGRLVYLGEYVQSLSSLTASGLSAAKVASPDGNRMESRQSALVSMSTVPLRSGEDLSSVNVGLGVLSCLAEDNR